MVPSALDGQQGETQLRVKEVRVGQLCDIVGLNEALSAGKAGVDSPVLFKSGSLLTEISTVSVYAFNKCRFIRRRPVGDAAVSGPR